MKNNFVGWEYLLAFVDDEIVEKLSKCHEKCRKDEFGSLDSFAVKKTLK